MSKLAKSVRDRLTPKRVPATHPDADLLTAFSEGTLRTEDRLLVLEHIGTCYECREVVFLASPAVESEQQVILVPSRARIWKWLAPVVAVAVAAVGVGLYSEFPSSPQVNKPEPVLTATTTKPQEVARPEAASSPVTELPRVAKTKPEKQKAASSIPLQERPEPAAKKANDLAVAGNIAAPVAPTPTETVEVSSAAPLISTQGTAPSVASTPKPPSTQETAPVTVAKARTTGAAESKKDSTRYETTAEVSSSAGFAPSGRYAKSLALRPHWRISNTGGLERSYMTGEWQPIVPKSKVVFRVVAVIGTHVWAGGSKGELYHSKDDGNSWKNIDVTSSGQHLTSAIISIRFEDEKNGTLATESGEVWGTADEGKSWKKQ